MLAVLSGAAGKVFREAWKWAGRDSSFSKTSILPSVNLFLTQSPSMSLQRALRRLPLLVSDKVWGLLPSQSRPGGTG